MKKLSKKLRMPTSIQTNMLFYFSIFMISILIIITIILYQTTNNTMKKSASKYADQVLDQVALSIDAYFGYMEDIAEFATSSNVSDNYLSQTLNSIKEVRTDIDSIYIFDKNMRLIHPADPRIAIRKDYNIKKEQWYIRAYESKGNSVISPTNVQKFVLGSNNWVVSLSKVLDNNNYNEENLLLIQMNYKVINDICSNIDLGTKGYVYIIDDEGAFIYHPQLQLINSGIKTENVTQIVSTTLRTLEQNDKLYNIKSLNSGHRIVGVTYLDEFDLKDSDMLNIFVIVILASLIIVMLGAATISGSIVRPLKKLEMVVNEVESGNLDITIDIKSTDEIEAFSNSLQSMIITIRQLLEQIKDDEQKIRKSELKALQAQINPHFLYNTLESIIWLSDDKQHEKVKDMVSALSKYFRIVLSKGKETITIEEEVEHIKNYLVIQKIRYSSMLDYEVNVDEDILHYHTLKVLIQPIVENAIYHGIKSKYGGGKVTVNAYGQDDDIKIIIEDNGIGMKPMTLKNIFSPSSSKQSFRGGVGMSNVNERIKLMYGEEYGLAITSKRRVGTTVIITIPKKQV
jgi:two-component system, sensor histidine kinase YesM